MARIPFTAIFQVGIGTVPHLPGAGVIALLPVNTGQQYGHVILRTVVWLPSREALRIVVTCETQATVFKSH